jgi:hypothetical protein
MAMPHLDALGEWPCRGQAPPREDYEIILNEIESPSPGVNNLNV